MISSNLQKHAGWWLLLLSASTYGIGIYLTGRFLCQSVGPNVLLLGVAIVQINGSQPPDDEQNAAHSPSSLTTGASEYANKVPEVPRLMTSLPGATAPVPHSAIMLSPPPTATWTLDGRPKKAALQDLLHAVHPWRRSAVGTPRGRACRP